MREYLRMRFFSRFENLEEIVLFFCCPCCPQACHEASEKCPPEDLNEMHRHREFYINNVEKWMDKYQQDVDPDFKILRVSSAHLNYSIYHKFCGRQQPTDPGRVVGGTGSACCVVM